MELTAILGILTGFGLVVLLPITALLLTHQRRMAELHTKAAFLPTPELDRLRQEVAELKQIVHQQAIQMDTLISRQHQVLNRPEDASIRIDA